VTHLVTLLSQKEGSQTIGMQARSAGLTWTWIPMPNGDIPREELVERLSQMRTRIVSSVLDKISSDTDDLTDDFFNRVVGSS
jgi:hypothetical protein